MTLHKAITEAHLSHSERVSNMKVITEYKLNKFTKDSEWLLRMQDSVLRGPTRKAQTGDLELGWTGLKSNYTFHSAVLSLSLPLLSARVSAMSFHVHGHHRSNRLPVGRLHAAACVKLSGAQNWCAFKSSGTSLCGDDGNVMPLLLFPIQFHGGGDEAIVRGDTEQGLGVRLGINWVPEKK